MAARPWTWVSGSNATNAPGVYGTKGVAAVGNVPGARGESVTWIDAAGDLWLFGGAGSVGGFNDLWSFAPVSGLWTWVSGSDVPNGNGVYGTQGVAAASNVPGARSSAVSWTVDGNFWLFGGAGYDSTGALGELNDLWVYKPSLGQWTWVGGSNTSDALGMYGTQGIAAASNAPPGRESARSWTDRSGNLWLFGGVGVSPMNSSGSRVLYNDVWKYSPSTGVWTWMAGIAYTNGDINSFAWGTQGVPAPGNSPLPRHYASAWTDSVGKFWLFGGEWSLYCACTAFSNDLWVFDPATSWWAWMRGGKVTTAWSGPAPSVYGSQGVPAADNDPGARERATAWADSSGNLWLFSGVPGGSVCYCALINDLWQFNTGTGLWTWMSGSNTPFSTGVYGTRGVAALTNVPGARSGAVSWTDHSGNLWLFGGFERAQQGTALLNDLWKYGSQ